MKKFVALISITLITTSCFKTAEDIAREKQVDEQLDQSSKIIADLTFQVEELKSRLASTSGKLEEIDYKSQRSSEEQHLTVKQTIDQLNAQVKALSEDNKKNQALISNINKELKDQKKYIQKVNSALAAIGGSKVTKSSKKSSLLQQAHRAFEKNQKSKAKKLYLETLDEGTINAAQRNHVYFNLGLLNYWDSKYDDALVYFSKIYTKYPRSSFAPRSLLYIARSFGKSGKSDEANATYQELINNYPKSKHSKTAKKEIK